jgi:omega-6 fatty acid desaturase (delta-12 desaturase)
LLTTAVSLKELKRAIIDRHVKPDNLKGLAPVVTTLLPLAALWYAAVLSAQVSYGPLAGVVLLMSLFLLRVFVLMHECGHGSLFRTGRLNRAFGFIFGVVSGMPQYVWSMHHQHHHSTNGNWARYRGPLNIVTVADYAAMTAGQQRGYRNARNIWLAPLAGFLYLIVYPRLTWLEGTFGLVRHVVKRKIAQPRVSIKAHALDFKTPCWSSAEEYRHMLWNNVALFGLWGLMGWMVGPVLFLVCYTLSVALAGGAGILLFTVQHNFEHSYASADEGWDYDQAAMEGTSFLDLPRWLNWFTANIGYHHIHHLSARIPSYCLVQCHDEHADLFAGVTRIRLSQIPAALKFILWDTDARRIVSVAQYQQTAALAAGSSRP